MCLLRNMSMYLLFCNVYSTLKTIVKIPKSSTSCMNLCFYNIFIHFWNEKLNINNSVCTASITEHWRDLTAVLEAQYSQNISPVLDTTFPRPSSTAAEYLHSSIIKICLLKSSHAIGSWEQETRPTMHS